MTKLFIMYAIIFALGFLFIWGLVFQETGVWTSVMFTAMWLLSVLDDLSKVIADLKQKLIDDSFDKLKSNISGKSKFMDKLHDAMEKSKNGENANSFVKE